MGGRGKGMGMGMDGIWGGRKGMGESGRDGWYTSGR